MQQKAAQCMAEQQTMLAVKFEVYGKVSLPIFATPTQPCVLVLMELMCATAGARGVLSQEHRGQGTGVASAGTCESPTLTSMHSPHHAVPDLTWHTQHIGHVASV